MHPTAVQHKQTGAVFEDVELFPHAPATDAVYCSEDFHIPLGTVCVHTVQSQEQQILQQGHAQYDLQHPKLRGKQVQASQTAVELQQVVILTDNDGSVVGPTTFPFPGYALLLIFVGLKGAIDYTYTSLLVEIPTDNI